MPNRPQATFDHCFDLTGIELSSKTRLWADACARGHVRHKNTGE